MPFNYKTAYDLIFFSFEILHVKHKINCFIYTITMFEFKSTSHHKISILQIHDNILHIQLYH